MCLQKTLEQFPISAVLRHDRPTTEALPDRPPLPGLQPLCGDPLWRSHSQGVRSGRLIPARLQGQDRLCHGGLLLHHILKQVELGQAGVPRKLCKSITKGTCNNFPGKLYYFPGDSCRRLLRRAREGQPLPRRSRPLADLRPAGLRGSERADAHPGAGGDADGQRREDPGDTLKHNIIIKTKSET